LKVNFLVVVKVHFISRFILLQTSRNPNCLAWIYADDSSIHSCIVGSTSLVTVPAAHMVPIWTARPAWVQLFECAE